MNITIKNKITLASSQNVEGARQAGIYGYSPWVKDYERPDELSPLAQFIVDNMNAILNWISNPTVKIISSKITEADLLRKDAVEKQFCDGITFVGDKKTAIAAALKRAETIISSHDLEKERPIIEDYLFPEFCESGTINYRTVSGYFEHIAREIEKKATLVKIIDGFHNTKKYVIK